jgi:hypothetical protein
MHRPPGLGPYPIRRTLRRLTLGWLATALLNAVAIVCLAVAIIGLTRTFRVTIAQATCSALFWGMEVSADWDVMDHGTTCRLTRPGRDPLVLHWVGGQWVALQAEQWL